jgi:hypothetical protein
VKRQSLYFMTSKAAVSSLAFLLGISVPFAGGQVVPTHFISLGWYRLPFAVPSPGH